MPITTGNKPTRLNIRVSEHEKEVITRAAETLNTTVSSFVLQKAYAEAQVVLADQSQFRLSDKRWRSSAKLSTLRRKIFPLCGNCSRTREHLMSSAALEVPVPLGAATSATTSTAVVRR